MISVHMTTAQRYQNGMLLRAINSVLTQDFQDFEFIICDDASIDGTALFLQKLASNDSRIKILRNSKNINNVALSLANCFKTSDKKRKYITWMFDDNEMKPKCLSKLVDFMEKNSEHDFVFGKTNVLSPWCKLTVGDKSSDYIRKNIAQSSILIPNAGILFKRTSLEKFGWYDANILLRRSCDWEFFRRIINQGAKFSTLNEEFIDEYGEIEKDSLRKTYTMDLPLMQRYIYLRDKAQWSIDLTAALYEPTDKIPSGNWAQNELQLIYFIFLEYYISIGNMPKAFEWAEKLRPFLHSVPYYFDKLNQNNSTDNVAEKWGVLGAYAALIFSHVKNEYAQQKSQIANYSTFELIKVLISRYKYVYFIAQKIKRCVSLIQKKITRIRNQSAI